jgi:hypothetical protein
MLEEIPTILAYPLKDPVAFVILTVIVWIFSALGSFAFLYGGGAILFSQGLMTAYSFSAMARVSSGNMKSYIPDINDIYDLVRPIWLGLGALLISSIGIIAMLFLFPGAALFNFASPASSEENLFSFRFSVNWIAAAEAQEEDSFSAEEEGESEFDSAEEEEEGFVDEEEQFAEEDSATLTDDEEDFDLYPGYVTFLLLLAFGWKVFYGPAALAVAGVSQSFLQTINPLVGLDTIRRMGSVYWITMIIYSVISLVQLLAPLPFRGIPIVGGIIKALIDCYVALVVGCLLGLALQKKALELGLE